MNRSRAYETLKSMLGNEGAEVLLQYVDEIVTTKAANHEDITRLEGQLARMGDALRHLDEKAATKEDLARLDGRLGRLENTVTHLDEKMATKLQVAELAGHLTTQIVELSGKVDGLPKEVDYKLSKLDHKFQLYFVALALLVVLTNPKAIELFGKLMGLVK